MRPAIKLSQYNVKTLECTFGYAYIFIIYKKKLVCVQ